ncbi:MAG: hypothetical protein J5J00_01125 [Deltaproteobacteria bacterium]|nr:hypothetical protein [Deltaproteobacteria bacterium]
MRLFTRRCKRKQISYRLKIYITALFATCFPPFSLRADQRDNPDPIPGWTHSTELNRDTPKRHGLLLNGGDVTFSSPVIADIDGDPSNGLEVAVGGADGVLHAYKANGELLWNVQLPNASCRQASSINKLLSSPAVGVLKGDGMPHVIVGYGGVGGSACGGGVVAVRGSDGQTVWHFDLKKFAKKERFGSISHAVFSSPAVADVDGDGKLEVGFGSFDRNVYLLNHDGSVRWYYNAADTIWSSPAFADIDNDSKLEMIIGTDISANSRLRPPTKNGGYVYAFDTSDRKGKRIFFRDRSISKWQTYFDQVIYSSPIIADVLPDSPGEEVLVGSGCFFPQRGRKKKGRWVKVMRLKDGKVLRTLPTAGCSSSSPAVGDIDDDGVLEVVATVNGDKSIGGDGKSRIMAFKAASSSLLWSIIPTERGRNDPWGGNFQSPVVADLDGNGSLEVLVANGASVGIYSGRDGFPLTCQDSSCTNPYMLYAFDTLRSTPAVGDVNNDGQLDVVIAGGHTSSGGLGVLYGWTNFGDVLQSSPGLQAPLSVPWQMFRGNSGRTAKYRN